MTKDVLIIGDQKFTEEIEMIVSQFAVGVGKAQDEAEVKKHALDKDVRAINLQARCGDLSFHDAKGVAQYVKDARHRLALRPRPYRARNFDIEPFCLPLQPIKHLLGIDAYTLLGLLRLTLA